MNQEESFEVVYKFLKVYAIQAGNVLMDFRGKVKNTKKDSTSNSIEQTDAGMALTDLDLFIQEGFLFQLHKVLSNSGLLRKFAINAEEDTPGKRLLQGRLELGTIHQDPLDGTLPYTEGKDTFATGYGISDPNHYFTHTVIYAPARDELYLASPRHCRVINSSGLSVSVDPDAEKPNMSRVFEKRFLSDKGKEVMRKAGFVLEKLLCAHTNIPDVARGYAGLYLFGDTNVHDSLLPYPFARQLGARLCDVNGNPISGTKIVTKQTLEGLTFARMPSIVYFSKSFPNAGKVLDIFSQKENLFNPQMLGYNK